MFNLMYKLRLPRFFRTPSLLLSIGSMFIIDTWLGATLLIVSLVGLAYSGRPMGDNGPSICWDIGMYDDSSTKGTLVPRERKPEEGPLDNLHQCVAI